MQYLHKGLEGYTQRHDYNQAAGGGSENKNLCVYVKKFVSCKQRMYKICKWTSKRLIVACAQFQNVLHDKNRVNTTTVSNKFFPSA